MKKYEINSHLTAFILCEKHLQEYVEEKKKKGADIPYYWEVSSSNPCSAWLGKEGQCEN